MQVWLGSQGTARLVTAVEYLDAAREPGYVEAGTLEQVNAQMWCVGGIFEPAGPRHPWLVVHARGHGGQITLRRPCIGLPQDIVVRVHDAY